MFLSFLLLLLLLQLVEVQSGLVINYDAFLLADALLVHSVAEHLLQVYFLVLHFEFFRFCAVAFVLENAFANYEEFIAFWIASVSPSLRNLHYSGGLDNLAQVGVRYLLELEGGHSGL